MWTYKRRWKKKIFWKHWVRFHEILPLFTIVLFGLCYSLPIVEVVLIWHPRLAHYPEDSMQLITQYIDQRYIDKVGPLHTFHCQLILLYHWQSSPQRCNPRKNILHNPTYYIIAKVFHNFATLLFGRVLQMTLGIQGWPQVVIK